MNYNPYLKTTKENRLIGMEDIHKRTRFLVERLGPNPNAFAVKMGVAPASVHFAMGKGKRKSRPKFDFIHALLTSFPEVSPRWYILGKGIWNGVDKLGSGKFAHKREFDKMMDALNKVKEENNRLKILYAEERLINERLKRVNKKNKN